MPAKRTASSAPDRNPLTKQQRQQVAIRRGQAFDHQARLGLTDLPRETWCAQNTHQVFARRSPTGTSARTSLTQAVQADFALLMAYFSELAGQEDEARKWYQRDELGLTQSEDLNDTPTTRGRELFLLREHCEEKGVPFPAYPLAIARNRRWLPTADSTLQDLPAQQLFSLKVTVKSKAKPRAPQP
jgi:hypothetical protein